MPRLDDKTFLEYADMVALSLLNNVKHSFDVPVYELNLLMIEIEHRYIALTGKSIQTTRPR